MFGRSALIVILCAPVVAAAEPQPACDAAAVLRSAASAYRSVESFRDVSRAIVRVPGAPPHEEVVELGWAPGMHAQVRIPGLYVLQHSGDMLHVAEDGSTEASVSRPLEGGLQATIDTLFEGQGPPLVPLPLLLRQASTDEDTVQAFRLRLLGPLAVQGCTSSGGRREVLLRAANGRVRARFDASAGWLVGASVEFVPAEGQQPITAEIDLAPRPGVAPVPIRPAAEAAGALARPAPGPLPPLTRLDGSELTPVDLRGSITVLEFWATWCAPCRVTLPAVQALADWAAAERLPVRVLLVNTREEFRTLEEARPRLERYLSEAGVRLPTLVDLGNAAHAAAGGGLPLTLLIDAEGRIAETYGGFDPDLTETLKQRIKEISSTR